MRGELQVVKNDTFIAVTVPADGSKWAGAYSCRTQLPKVKIREAVLTMLCKYLKTFPPLSVSLPWDLFAAFLTRLGYFMWEGLELFYGHLEISCWLKFIWVLCLFWWFLSFSHLM